jgi:hypothetical protein
MRGPGGSAGRGPARAAPQFTRAPPRETALTPAFMFLSFVAGPLWLGGFRLLFLSSSFSCACFSFVFRFTKPFHGNLRIRASVL